LVDLLCGLPLTLEVLVTVYEPQSEEALSDPHGAHRWMLAECPVHRHEEMDIFTVNRGVDVIEVARNTTRFTAARGQGPKGRPGGGLHNDEPEHSMFRRMVLAWFSLKRQDQQRPVIEELCDELCNAMEATGTRRAELHDDLACPLPVILISRLLGVAEEDRDRFKVWSDAQVLAMGRADASNKQTQAEMHTYLLAGVLRRRELLADGLPLPDDLISGLVSAAAQAPRDIEDSELIGLLAQLLVGGNETTTSLITNCIWRLLEDRSRLWAAVVADPTLVEIAVEESLRFDAPVLGLFRETVCPVSFNDGHDGAVEVPAGARVQMNYAAACRDPSMFDDPDTFRLDRDLGDLRRRQLAFGSGVHFCLGANLARTEAIVALHTLVTRFPTLRLDGPTERIAPWFLWGRHRLPVAW
jgi:cytochrome P450